MRLIAIVLLLLLNGYFVAVEFALVRSRRTRLDAMVRRGDRFAWMALQATGALPRLLSASQLGITIASLALGALAQDALGSWFRTVLGGLPWAIELSVRVGVAGTLALAIVTYCHVVFAELAPRSVALAHPETVARWLAPPLMLFERVVRPFTATLNWSAMTVLRVLRQRPQSAMEAVHSPEELRSLVEQSEEVGMIEPANAGMIEGVFELSEKNARDVMTPRTEIDALPIEATLDDVLSLVEDSVRSRYPVFHENVDNIIGVLLTKDLIPLLRTDFDEFVLRTVMRPVHVVPGSRKVEEVLSDFQRLKEHMAVVLDEYGGTAGIVTMEDLIEEIVGDILDEYDDPVEAPSRESADTVVVPGSMHIGELNERFALSLPEDGFTTIGGFVFGALGRLPIVGDHVSAGPATLVVREMDGRRIESLAMALRAPDAS
jgi:CBS domain containing-hemolysin-like protein